MIIIILLLVIIFVLSGIGGDKDNGKEGGGVGDVNIERNRYTNGESGIVNSTADSKVADSKIKPKHKKPATIDRQMINVMGAKKANLTVLTHNVLADTFTMPSFRHSPEWIREWKSRKPKLVAEYVKFQPDILGLQELDDCAGLLDELNKQMMGKATAGKTTGKVVAIASKSATATTVATTEPPIYKSIYAKRVNTADGTGIFYNSTNCKLIEYVEIRYDAGAMMTSDDAVDCVGLIAVFEKDARQFIIATTHHYWDPRKLKLKHKQVEYLLFELEKIERKYPKIPVVVMGDFNFTPTGRDIDIPINFSPYDTMIGKFNSAYRFILGDEPEYTTLYKRGPRHLHSAKVPPRSAWAVDYIFYKNADVMGVLEIPNAEKITSENWRGIPNSQYGSDHLSLLADLRI